MIDYAKQLAEQVKGMSGVDDSMPGTLLFSPCPFPLQLTHHFSLRLHRAQGGSDAEERRSSEIRGASVEGD